jgi:c-di-GMP-binding flagellar brake protein YcgR
MSDRRTANDRKARQSDDLDFLSFEEQRRHRRVRSSAFAGVPVVLAPAPPFFGDPLDGTMVDLSGGGAGVIMKEALPVKTKMKIWMALPGREAVNGVVSVRRVFAVEGGFFAGLQFLDVAEDAAGGLAQMSADVDACDARRRDDDAPVCRPGCAFRDLCDRPEKR